MLRHRVRCRLLNNLFNLECGHVCYVSIPGAGTHLPSVHVAGNRGLVATGEENTFASSIQRRLPDGQAALDRQRGMCNATLHTTQTITRDRAVGENVTTMWAAPDSCCSFYSMRATKLIFGKYRQLATAKAIYRACMSSAVSILLAKLLTSRVLIAPT